jgi:hypothetical protein
VKIIDQQINAAILADDTCQNLTLTGSAEAKMTASTRIIHSRQRKSAGRSPAPDQTSVRLHHSAAGVVLCFGMPLRNWPVSSS